MSPICMQGPRRPRLPSSSGGVARLLAVTCSPTSTFTGRARSYLWRVANDLWSSSTASLRRLWSRAVTRCVCVCVCVCACVYQYIYIYICVCVHTHTHPHTHTHTHQVRLSHGGAMCKQILIRSSPRTIVHAVDEQASTELVATESPASGFIFAPAGKVKQPATPEAILACVEGSQVVLSLPRSLLSRALSLSLALARARALSLCLSLSHKHTHTQRVCDVM